jgi:hypothetical protein
MRLRKQSAAALRFAAEVAARLDKVVPPGLSVRAEGTSVNVYSATDDRHASAGAELISEEDGRSLSERAALAALGILDGAQDGVMEILREQWPVSAARNAPDAGTRVDGNLLLMWFGDENAPVITLPPLNLDDVVGAA